MAVVRLFLAVPWVCLQFVIVVFPDHTIFVVLLLLNGSLLNTYQPAILYRYMQTVKAWLSMCKNTLARVFAACTH